MTGPTSFLIPALAAAALTAVVTPVVRRLAIALGAVDAPGERKPHGWPTPRLGGLAVVASVVCVVLAAETGLFGPVPRVPPQVMSGMVAGLLPILAVSIWDDIRRLPPWPKLIAHTAGAVIAVAGGVVLPDTLHLLGVGLPVGRAAGPLTVVWLVGVTNSFNIVDGLDGLAAGLALIAASSLAAVCFSLNDLGVAWSALVLVGALAGFLPYNRHPARVFLGDSGATALGFTFACLAVASASRLTTGFAILLPVFVVAIPVTDTLTAVARRTIRGVRSGRAPQLMRGDSNHIHHRLLARGVGHERAVWVLHVAAIAVAGLAVLSIWLNDRAAGLLVVALVTVILLAVGRLGYDEFAFTRRTGLRRPDLSTGRHAGPETEALAADDKALAKLE